jgi:hypothetical protein
LFSRLFTVRPSNLVLKIVFSVSLRNGGIYAAFSGALACGRRAVFVACGDSNSPFRHGPLNIKHGADVGLFLANMGVCCGARESAGELAESEQV